MKGNIMKGGESCKKERKKNERENCEKEEIVRKVSLIVPQEGRKGK